MDRDDFKKRYPALAKEMEEGKGKADLRFEVEAPQPKRKFAGYEPGVLDFLRRCSCDEEALEIIEYMKGRGEVTGEEAEALCAQLREKGVRSFGSKKEPGHYEKEG
jgi:hypothetical protein